MSATLKGVLLSLVGTALFTPVFAAGQFFNILAYREADAALLGPVNYT